ncbi:MAG: LacI family transcriptional regulator [Lentisphaerae bacterium]|nr:LacI family transcriptional regulator [Lentisphaerota bacterium]
MSILVEKVQKRKYTGRQIIAELSSYIRENEHAAGIRLPTDEQLARRYGVSLKTVQRAMSVLTERGLVLRRRGQGTYCCEAQKKQKKQKIGLFLWQRNHLDPYPDLSHTLFDALTVEMTNSLEAANFDCSLILEDTENKAKLRLFKTDLAQFDLVIAAAGVLETAEAYLRNSPTPVILINDDVVHPGPWHQVVYDYSPGFEAALRHFMKQGKRRFFVSALYKADVSRRRLEALREVARRLGLDDQALLVYEGASELVSTLLAGRKCAEHYCRERLYHYPVISTSDYITYGFLSHTKEQGLQAGRDFQLISYDNLEGELEKNSLKLDFSAISHPLREARLALVKMAEELTDKQKKTEPYYRVYMVPAKNLVLRSSS